MKEHLFFILAFMIALCSCEEYKQSYNPSKDLREPQIGTPYVSDVTMQSITVNLRVSDYGNPKVSEFSAELFKNQGATESLDKKYMKQISENEYSVTFYKDISNFSVGETYYFEASTEYDSRTIKSSIQSVLVPDKPIKFRVVNVSEVKYRVADNYDYTVSFEPVIDIYDPKGIEKLYLVFDDEQDRLLSFDKDKASVYTSGWSMSSNSSLISFTVSAKALMKDGSTYATQSVYISKQYSGSTGGGGGGGDETATYVVKTPALSITASNPYNYLPVSYNSYLNHLKSSGLTVYKSGSSYYWKDADGAKHTCTTGSSSVSGSGNYYYESKIDTDHTLIVAKIYISFTCPKF